MPFEVVNNDYFITRIISLYFQNACIQKGSRWINEYAGILDEELCYYTSVDRKFKKEIQGVSNNYLYCFNELLAIARTHHQSDFIEKYRDRFEYYYQYFTSMEIN